MASVTSSRSVASAAAKPMRSPGAANETASTYVSYSVAQRRSEEIRSSIAVNNSAGSSAACSASPRPASCARAFHKRSTNVPDCSARLLSAARSWICRTIVGSSSTLFRSRAWTREASALSLSAAVSIGSTHETQPPRAPHVVQAQ